MYKNREIIACYFGEIFLKYRVQMLQMQITLFRDAI